MSYNFRLPNITAMTPEGKLEQMQSFLYQTVEQLNWAMNAVESAGGSGHGVKQNVPGKTGGDEGESGAAVSFNELKSLIIKSADIVNAYYEKISARLSGEYVAKSDFGTYTELTDQQIEANSTAIEQYYTNLQQIITDIENLGSSLIETNAYIRSGLLDYDDAGVPVYGLEIGQRNEVNGVEAFNKYARFTSGMLAFYDSGDDPVAYISNNKLYISHIEVTGSFAQGGFLEEVRLDKSIVTKWVGGDG